MRFFTGTAIPRVVLAAGLLGAALVAGCDATGTPNANGSASPSTGAEPSSSAVSLSPEMATNTETVCTDVKKIITDNTVEFSKRIVSAIDAAQSDETRAVAAIKEVKSLLNDWASGLRTQADKALQPTLRQALATEAKSFETAATKINTTEDLKNAGSILSGDDVAQAGQQVQEACGAYWLR